MLLSEYPILCSPEKICIEGGFLTRPAHTRVIVGNNAFRQTTIHALSFRIRRDRYCLPWLCLSLSNHQLLSVCAGLDEQFFSSSLLPGTLTSIKVQCLRPDGRQCVTRVV